MQNQIRPLGKREGRKVSEGGEEGERGPETVDEWKREPSPKDLTKNARGGVTEIAGQHLTNKRKDRDVSKVLRKHES